MHTVRLIVRGIVQGVGFRMFALSVAERHGVRGWVRNLPDGSVEIAAQGAIDAFADEIAAGPRHGRVTAVERRDADDPEYLGFEVRW